MQEADCNQLFKYNFVIFYSCCSFVVDTIDVDADHTGMSSQMCKYIYKIETMTR